MKNIQEQVKKAFCYQKLFWPFTVWINCSSDLKDLANSRPSALNFKSFSCSLEQFFLTVDKNNFDNKIPFLWIFQRKWFDHQGTPVGECLCQNWIFSEWSNETLSCIYKTWIIVVTVITAVIFTVGLTLCFIYWYNNAMNFQSLKFI